MQVIGITGKKRHGKNTVADIINKVASCTTREYSFAGALKLEAARVLNVSLEELEKEKAVFRPFLQWYGTEFIRNYQQQEDYWIRKVSNSIHAAARALPYHDIIHMITDVRFNNEALLVKSLRGFVIEVVNPRIESDDSHSSEKGIDPLLVDYTIVNDGTIQQLTTKVKEALCQLMK